MLLAAELQAAGREVTVCARRPFERLVVEGGMICPRHVVTEPSGEADWVLVALKAQDSPGAAPWIDALGGQVVAVQNGIEHRENLGRMRCPRSSPRPPSGSARAGCGTITATSSVPDEPASSRLAGVFEGTILDVELVGDFHTVAWRKLLATRPRTRSPR